MKKLTLKVKAVIFDMDGVITNTMPDHFRAWRKVLKDEGVHVTYNDIYSREGQQGFMSVKELFAKYNEEFNEARARQLLRKKEDLFKKIVKRRFISGSRSFIKKLKKEQFKLALVTGTSRHELLEMLPENIRSRFDVIITGTDVQNGKPHPEPFLKAIKKLKIKASQAVVIENAPFGIRSAKKAGLSCLALETSLPKNYLTEACAVYPNFKELITRVTFIFN